jgi:cell wall-associated NlpC family hydrolase
MTNEVFKYAEEYLGLPYVLGGDGETCTDCGMFTMKAYCDADIPLESRCADDQAEQFKSAGQFTTDITQAQAGDLIFFANTYGSFPEGTITHVGIYVDDTTMLHCSCSCGVAYTHDLQTYWMRFFAGIGTVLRPAE